MNLFVIIIVTKDASRIHFYSCWLLLLFSQASAVPDQSYFQKIKEKYNLTSEQTFMSRPGTWRRVAWAEGWKGTTQLFPMLSWNSVLGSLARTGHWYYSVGLGKRNSPRLVLFALRMSSRNSESTQAPLTQWTREFIHLWKAQQGVGNYLHLYWLTWGWRHQPLTQMASW